MRTNPPLFPVGLLLAAMSPVFGQPVITEQPVNQTNILGSTANFTVRATGTPEPIYQWQILSGDWTNLSDRTNATLVLSNVLTSDQADYRAVITDGAGTTNSAVAHLYVVEPPAIVQVSADQVVIAGTNRSLIVRATGTWLSYLWRQDGVDVAGATNSTLFFSSVQPTNAGAYTALVTNLAGTSTSRVCQLSVAAGWVFTNAQGTQLPYRLFLPPKYDPATNYPLVLFWHGAGEVGTDNVGQMKDNGQFSFLSAANLAKFPCFYLAPQIPYSLHTCEQYYTFLECATNLLKDFFGLDSGAQIGLEYRFGIVRNVEVGIHRTSDKTIEFFGQYGVVRQGAQLPVDVSVLLSIDGTNNFRDEHSPAFGLLLSRTVGDQAAVYVEPIFVHHSNVFQQATIADDNTFMIGLGARLRVRGYGFVKRPDDSGGEDVFVHMETVRDAHLADLQPGQTLEARIAPSGRGLTAVELRPCNASLD